MTQPVGSVEYQLAIFILVSSIFVFDVKVFAWFVTN
jgi:hypothetical protein